ncbi:probable 26S proteasome non-ATPase regulatory subunit 3 [Solanum dulcamara]|uniref:probable 26S proteasome non-ATPase regulatory subunit 3 n=1 Tax=Solanum dulcamara TaxID=45834 RepID=UPI002486C537|nr:probable 26S proteasome non-ATPase regulatory subunit 3 [Solanum dulcamara]
MAFLVVIVSVFYIAMVVVWVSQVFFKMNDQEVKVEHQSPPFVYDDFSVDPSVFRDLKEVVSLIENGAYKSEVRKIYRAMRLTMKLRSKLKASLLSAFLNYVLAPDSEVHERLSSYLPQDRHDTQVDVEMPATESKHLLPEFEIFCYLLVLIFLIDQKKYNEAKACSSESIVHLKSMNSITADVLASRLYFYYSLSYELAGDLAEIRGNLLALYRSATVHHNNFSQETLLNLLLRNYLHYNLYDQAEKFCSKAHQVEALSNQQYCRYLFYQGKIKTIQLEYTDAKDFLQAAQKGPTTAVGFQIQCNKWAVIVHLLLGEIPQRTVFTQKRMEKALRPYFELTNAFRVGDLELLRRVAEKFSSTFSQDRTSNLIIRLRRNVIRTGLRNISVSYTRISLADIAKKLKLDFENPVGDAENIVAKAIRDGIIDATLDHANGWLVSKATGDVYSTYEPQIAFDSRIVFCLNMHNEALRALRFPRDLRSKESVAT